jgi:hypothetical protein
MCGCFIMCCVQFEMVRKTADVIVFGKSPTRLNPLLGWKDLFETEGVRSAALTKYGIHSARPRN